MLNIHNSRNIYTTRINRVITFIEENLDKPLKLETLAREACFSPYHFHRIFTAIVGETPNTFVNRVRLERAALLLLRAPSRSITDIAFSCGFSSSAVFSRSFRQYFALSASEWRKQAQQGAALNRKISKTNRKNWKDRTLLKTDRGSSTNEKHIYQSETDRMNVNVRQMPRFHVAYVANLEGYNVEKICEAWRTLYTWASARDLLTPDAQTLGISFDDPTITEFNKCRYYLCLTVPGDIPADETVGLLDIPAGKHGVYRFEGLQQEIIPTYQRLYAEWLPESGYQPADFPCYEIYYATPDNPYEGIFRMDLCIPVIPL